MISLRLPALGAILMAALTLAGPTLAHHGWGNYDGSKTVTVEGKIGKVAWGSPHVTVWVEGGDGKLTEAILAPPTRMQARGLAEEMMTVGTPVSLDAYPHREKADEVRAERIRVNGAAAVELR